MPLEARQKLAHYEILEPIGKGGMGEVYRAKDSKLGRDVAIKVLPDEFAQDEERLRRFQREAKVLASLNHPNIASIYGLEQSDETHYLVLELVPGETLAERIARGPIPIDEALEIAKKIAGASEEAHEQGIVHRDLKPANIKITPDDKIKVLDFGLAKAFIEDASEGDAVTSMSPTITRDVTRVGVILGTAAYMSPEQAKGKRVDKRADIFAFGCVLYEMLTGRKAFPGDDVSEVLASVIKTEPDWSRLPAETPASVRRLLRRSLEKEHKRRLPDIAVARLEIDEDTDETEEPLPARRSQRLVPWAPTAVFAVAAAVAVWTRGPSAASSSPSRVVVALPSGQELSLGEQGAINPIAVSPDGQLLVYAAAERGSRTTRLFLRPLQQFTAQPIEGTEGAAAPFFSPDGRWIGFFTYETLQRVSVSGGLPVKICDTSALLMSASWGAEGTIVFSHFTLGLHRVTATGGTPEPLTLPDAAKGEFRHLTPQILPGGRHVLFTAASTNGFRAAILSLESNEWRIVLDDAEGARYVQGHLVYGQSGTLFAIPFDLSRMKTRGIPAPLLERVSHLPGLGSAHFAVSDTGTLVYPQSDAGAVSSRLVWVDRQGQATPIVDDPAPHSNPRLSPDGRQIVVPIGSDIWVYDVENGTRRRLTTDGYNLMAAWHPDGERITFSAVRADPEALFDLHSMPADRSTGPELLLRRKGRQFPFSWSPDGTVLVFAENNNPGGADISLLEGENASRFLAGSYEEVAPAFSPDGRWLAYESNETGQPEIYVTRYPDPGGSQLVSVNGGREPLWSRDGRELFYNQGDFLVVVPVESTDPMLEIGPPRVLFEVPYMGLDRGGMGYDVSPDGERFVMLELTEGTSSKFNVVLNWFSELERLVSTDNN